MTTHYTWEHKSVFLLFIHCFVFFSCVRVLLCVKYLAINSCLETHWMRVHKSFRMKIILLPNSIQNIHTTNSPRRYWSFERQTEIKKQNKKTRWILKYRLVSRYRHVLIFVDSITIYIFHSVSDSPAIWELILIRFQTHIYNQRRSTHFDSLFYVSKRKKKKKNAKEKWDERNTRKHCVRSNANAVLCAAKKQKIICFQWDGKMHLKCAWNFTNKFFDKISKWSVYGIFRIVVVDQWPHMHNKVTIVSRWFRSQ